jgi:predicted alpha-1,6-mannanase (GH76 family)
MAVLLGALAAMAAPPAAAAVTAVTAGNSDTILEAYNRAFYVEVEGKGAYYRETTDGGNTSFWMRAEQLEMILDAHQRTGSDRERDRFLALYHGFLDQFGRDWTGNEFNDDIMWMVIACTRGSAVTGDHDMLDVARTNFDACYARAWSEDLGGGLWWKTDNRSKNACVNGPGAIAAVLLSRALKDESYLARAEALYAWLRATLFDAETGRVSDNIRRSGRVSSRSYSYNQGTFAGAAHLLGHPEDAALAANFTRNTLCRDGLLPAYGETGDGGGFNGIAVRWIARFMQEHNRQADYLPWLQQNAQAAWDARRHADNLAWCRWPEPTPDGPRYSWGCSSAVVLLQLVPPPAKPGTGVPVPDAGEE